MESLEGDHVAVALSFKSVGLIEGGPEAFIDGLLEAVGSEGTIMMNTFTQNFPITAIPTDFVFDSERSNPYTGVIPSRFMLRKEARRSRHPTFSVAAIGRLAEYLTEAHDENANPYLPYERLAEVNGKYLCIGVGSRLVAVRHEVQRRSGLSVVPKTMGVLYKNAEGKTRLFAFVHPTCAENTSKLVPMLVARGILKRGRIGCANSLVANVDDLIREMCLLLREDPTLTLCENVLCWECRELERRLSLRGHIKMPGFLQENWIIRGLLDFRSETILRQYDPKYFMSLSEKGRTWQNIKYVLLWKFLYPFSLLNVSRFIEGIRNPRNALRFLSRIT